MVKTCIYKTDANTFSQSRKNLDRFKIMAGDEASSKGTIVCRVDEKIRLPKDNIALPWHEFSDWLKTIIN